MKYKTYTRKVLSKRYFVYALALLLVGGSLLASNAGNGGNPTHAAGADMLYVSPASGSHTVGTTFTVQVRENSNTDAINAVEVDLNYTASRLQLVGIPSINSAIFAIAPTNTGGGGSISMDVGSYSARTGDQLVATLTFKALAAGSANATYEGSSQVLSSSTNANVVSSMTGGAYTVTATSTGSKKPKPPTSTGSTGKASSPPRTTPVPSSTSTTSIAPKGNPTPVSVPNNSKVELNDSATVQTTPSPSKTVLSVVYYVNNKLVATVTQPPYTYSVDTNVLRNGTYTLLSKTNYSDGTVEAKTTSLLVRNPFGWTQFVLQIRHYAWLIIIVAIIIVDLIWTGQQWYRKRQLLQQHIHTHTPTSGGSTNPPDGGTHIHVGTM